MVIYVDINSRKLHVVFILKRERFLPALPGIPLRMPARLGRDLRLLLWCIFSMVKYLFLICAGITRFSKSLLWMSGISSKPSFLSKASFISWCVKAAERPKRAVHKTQARRKSMSQNLSAIKQQHSSTSHSEIDSVPLTLHWPLILVRPFQSFTLCRWGQGPLSGQRCDNTAPS